MRDEGSGRAFGDREAVLQAATLSRVICQDISDANFIGESAIRKSLDSPRRWAARNGPCLRTGPRLRQKGRKFLHFRLARSGSVGVGAEASMKPPLRRA